MLCKKCLIDKPELEFYPRKDRPINSYCKSCFNEYCIARWTERKKEAIEYKGGCCAYCGYNKYYGALEFHHLDPSQKDSDWNKIKKKSLDKIKTELDKCILLCANCHREEHARLRMEIENE